MAFIKSAAEDLPAREPVWETLSDMFLDTDTSLSRQWRVEQLSQAPYSVEQLEFILIDEVYPVCRYNLLSLAGEWQGFDSEWLKTRILCRLASPFRFLHPLNLGRIFIRTSTEWRATRKAILVARSVEVQNSI